MQLSELGPPSSLATRHAAPFRIRRISDKWLLTSLWGDWLFLDDDELRKFAHGDVPAGSPLHARLAAASLLRDELDVPKLEERLRARKSFLRSGPNLHAFVVTLRCNETCVYCHASRADMDAVHTDMSKETAEKCVEFALRTTSPFVTIEFQGGEPLVNFEVVKHVVEHARKLNAKAGKTLEFTMVSNLSLMDDEKLAFLLDHRVQICTSIDGPAPLHDKQRKLPMHSAHATAVNWIRRINDEYKRRGLDDTLYHVEALLTTTRETLPRWKEVVDTYVDLGCKALFLRPVDPFGFMARTASKVEYPRSEYMEFYRRATDYMLELNAKGVQILERYAAIFLTKILTGEDPNFLDIRSPGGAGIGQLGYSYDGTIYSCDEGRMLAAMGDETFKLGDVRTSRYRDVVGHPSIRAVVIASNRDSQPDCVSCTYNPYCGVPPVHAHQAQGHIWGTMRNSTLCAVHKGIQDYLFEKLLQNDPQTIETFRRWTTIRPREHFLQPPA